MFTVPGGSQGLWQLHTCASPGAWGWSRLPARATPGRVNQSAAFRTQGTSSTSHISAAFQAHPLLATGSRAFSSEALLGSVPPQIQTGSMLTDHCPAHTRSPWMRRPCTCSPGTQAEAGSTLGTSKLSAPTACSTQGNRRLSPQVLGSQLSVQGAKPSLPCLIHISRLAWSSQLTEAAAHSHSQVSCVTDRVGPRLTTEWPRRES